MESQKKLEPLRIDVKLATSKLSTQSSRLLPLQERQSAKGNQEKLQLAIEKKFKESGMKRYRFPKHELEEELDPDESLGSLIEAQMYDLHSQNKKATHSHLSSPAVSQFKLQRTDRGKVAIHSEYSNAKATKAFKGSSTQRMSTPDQPSEKLHSLLKKLGVQKERLRDFSSSTSKMKANDNCLMLAMKKPQFPETVPSNKQALILKYLRASRAKIESFKQHYLPDATRPSLLEFKSSLLGRPTGSQEQNSSFTGKSLGHILKSRQETSADKFKQLKLSCLGSLCQSPETKVKNSKSFLFGESAVMGGPTKDTSAEAYNIARRAGHDKPIFEIQLPGHCEQTLSVAGLSIPHKTSKIATFKNNKARHRGVTDRTHFRSVVD